MLDMKRASIRTIQHQLAAVISEVEQGNEIVITKHNRPVARLSPMTASHEKPSITPAAIRNYWRKRKLPPIVHSSVTHAELISDGRGDV